MVKEDKDKGKTIIDPTRPVKKLKLTQELDPDFTVGEEDLTPHASDHEMMEEKPTIPELLPVSKSYEARKWWKSREPLLKTCGFQDYSPPVRQFTIIVEYAFRSTIQDILSFKYRLNQVTHIVSFATEALMAIGIPDRPRRMSTHKTRAV